MNMRQPSFLQKACYRLWPLTILLLALLLPGKNFAQHLYKTILVDHRQRTYILHLPPDFSPAKKWPVIIALHGGGGTAQNTIRFYGLEEQADKEGFILLYPDAVNKAWNIPGMTSRVKNLDSTVNDVHFIERLMDTLVTGYRADEKRIFVTGMSRGAMFSFYLASALNSRVAGIAPVCGGISHTVAQNYTFGKPVPVLMINGTADPLVSYTGGAGKFNRRHSNSENADLLPAETLVEKIVTLNHCSAAPQTINLPNTNVNDGCMAIETVYTGGPAKVDFIKINGAGHTWPGGSQYLPKALVGRVCKDFSAGEKIVAFFSSIR